MKKTIVILLSLALLAFCFAGCAPAASETSAPAQTSAAADASAPAQTSSESTTGGADSSLADIQANGKLVLGLDDSFPPMGFEDENGEIVGFDIDLAKEVCKRLGVELVTQPIDWNSKEVELDSKNIDCIWNGLSITPEREEALSLSQPYMNNSQAIVVRSDSDIETKADLEGKVVGIQAGSSAMDAVDAEPEVRDTFGELVDMKDNVLALSELKNGTVDAVVADSVLIQYYTSQDVDSYKILDDNFGTEQYAIAFRKSDMALTEAVNGILDEMIEDGTFAEISNTWFGRDVSIAE